MNRRTYEFYEVRRDLAKPTEEILVQGSHLIASRFFECQPDQGSDLYLVRVSVLEVRKADIAN